MKAQSIHSDQVDFQDTTTDRPNADGVSLLPGFIGFYQDAQRIQREARQIYAVNESELQDACISTRDDIPTAG